MCFIKLYQLRLVCVCDQVKVKCDQEVTAVRQRIKFKTEQKGHTDIGTSDVKLEMEQEQADKNMLPVVVKACL
jgi:hypothetical protein